MQQLLAIKISLFLIIIISNSIIFNVVQSVTLQSDIEALKAFKSAIKPSSILPYSCLATWNFSTDPCAQPRREHFTCGLTCTSSSSPSSPGSITTTWRVNSLVLDPVNYSGKISPLISQLTQLAVIDFSENSFYGPLPSSLYSLPLLNTLILRSNSLSGSLPNSFANLKSLETLDLSRNFFTGSLPQSMNSLSMLRRFDASFNKFTGSIPKLPPNLIELAMKNNSLTGLLAKPCFDGLNQLAVVELSCNSFTGTIQSWFFLLPAIQQVNLANNSFTRVEIVSPVKGVSDLIAVDLGFNKIGGNVPTNLAGYPLLSSLSLRYNQFRGPIPGEYSKKATLKRLFLDGNYLIGKPPGEFFTGKMTVSGSLGDNCLNNCPVSSELCMTSQKSSSTCRQVYGRKWHQHRHL